MTLLRASFLVLLIYVLVDLGTSHELHSGITSLREVCPGVYSGEEPSGDSEFEELVSLGIKTIVSVDGVLPDLGSARKHGMSYVHIPMGYDEIDLRAQLSLANVAKTRLRPIYVHCHHGKHRGPVAAAILAMSCDSLDKQSALRFLHRAGTSKNYRGLWRAVEDYKKPDPETLLPVLVERAKVPSLASAMASIDRVYARLSECRTSEWETPTAHPDLTPRQLSLQLREALREARRHLPASAKPNLKHGLREAETTAAALETALAANNAVLATQAFQAVSQSCVVCHQAHRD